MAHTRAASSRALRLRRKRASNITLTADEQRFLADYDAKKTTAGRPLRDAQPAAPSPAPQPSTESRGDRQVRLALEHADDEEATADAPAEAPAAPVGDAPAPPPLDVPSPAELAAIPKPGEPAQTESGVMVAELYREWLTDWNEDVRKAGGRPYPAPLLKLAPKAVQRLWDKYLGPYVASSDLLDGINVATPPIWLYRFGKKAAAAQERQLGTPPAPEPAPAPPPPPAPRQEDTRVHASLLGG